MVFKNPFFVLLALLCLSGCAMSDVGPEVENFNCVDIRFSPPNMPEQRAFKLRGELSKKETEILVDAIPAITRFLNFMRRSDKENVHAVFVNAREPYAYIEQPDVHLAVASVHDWRVSEEQIQFVVDYLVSYGEMGKATIGEYRFRDAYIFKKVSYQWIFFDSFGDKPYGFLKCKSGDAACTLDPKLW